jgi:hypothetical protein
MARPLRIESAGVASMGSHLMAARITENHCVRVEGLKFRVDAARCSTFWLDNCRLGFAKIRVAVLAPFC